MTVKIKRTSENLYVESQYSPELPKKARQLSGKWDSLNKFWIFPIAAEDHVRELYLDVYGQWDDVVVESVDVVCYVTEVVASEVHESLSISGRVIARAFGRDSGAKTGDGIIVIKGGFDSCGSMKNWRVKCKEDTVFKILSVPRLKAEEMLKNPTWCEKIEIEENKKLDRDELLAERERLEKRIAQINEILN